MLLNTFIGIIIPFLGTVLGSVSVLYIRKEKNGTTERILSSFASGIMLAASIWSLILPSLEYNLCNNFFAVLQTVFGIYSGVLIMILLDKFSDAVKISDNFSDAKTFSQFVAVTLHNIPEGMAVGLVFSSLLYNYNQSELQGAYMLSFGIAVQNIPEGAIVSMPLINKEKSKTKSIVLSVLSGLAEPFGAVIAILLTKATQPVFPFFLSFAAGAMIYVVFRHLMSAVYDKNERLNNIVSLTFISGFIIMMSLDVILG